MSLFDDVNRRLASVNLHPAPAQPHVLKLKLTPPPAPAPAHTLKLNLGGAAAPAAAPPPKKLSFLHVSAPSAAPASPSSAAPALGVDGSAGVTADAGSYDGGGDAAAAPTSAVDPLLDQPPSPAPAPPAVSGFTMTPSLWALAGLGGLALIAVIVSARSGYSVSAAG